VKLKLISVTIAQSGFLTVIDAAAGTGACVGKKAVTSLTGQDIFTLLGTNSYNTLCTSSSK
jgi:hypothetical protein